MKVKRIALRSQAAEAIAKRESFIASSMSAGYVSLGSASRLGQLPDEHRVAWGEAIKRGLPMYAIWSYETPIAWVEQSGRITIPDVRYSVTTSKHQGIVRGALGK